MSYLGAVEFIMGGSGFESLWETVYPSVSVIHMTYIFSSCASLTSAALDAMLLLTHEHLNDEDQRKRLCLLHALLINTDYSNVDVLEDTAIHELRKTISNARSFLEWKLYRSNKIS